MTTGKKLAIGGVMVAAVTGYMAYVGASTSWQYYLGVDQCLADGRSLIGQPIRVSGKVARGSLWIAADRTKASFCLKGSSASLAVVCPGPPPDNLAEDIDVVVEGRLEDVDVLRAEKVLTRCASKYRSQGPPTSSQRTTQTP